MLEYNEPWELCRLRIRAISALTRSGLRCSRLCRLRAISTLASSRIRSLRQALVSQFLRSQAAVFVAAGFVGSRQFLRSQAAGFARCSRLCRLRAISVQIIQIKILNFILCWNTMNLGDFVVSRPGQFLRSQAAGFARCSRLCRLRAISTLTSSGLRSLQQAL